MIVLERPIKTLGVFDVRVILHPEVSVTVTVNVARSDDEAELQKTGVNVIDQMFEDDQAEVAAQAIEMAEAREAAADEADEADAARIEKLKAEQAAAKAAEAEGNGLSADGGDGDEA
jgi:large subunit ribosomal protein L9